MPAWGLRLARLLVTGLMVLLAVLVGRWMWIAYEVEPWTRDGRVRADVVAVSPDISGFVVQVLAQDNRPVRRGDVLFILDQPRYRLALEQSEAAAASQQVALAEAQREWRRSQSLGELVSAEALEQSRARVDETRAALAQAVSNREVARLNLERTTVRAPVNGIVTNLELRPGDYLSVGRQALALVDTDTLHVDGYFEETKLGRIRTGDAARVRLMGEPGAIRGHVESISAGIEDRERSPSPNLLPNVNPTFSWVRLAQRVPVRIAIDHTPPGVRLVSGRTATVTILEPAARAGARAWRPW